MFSFVDDCGRAVALANGFVCRTLGEVTAPRGIRDEPVGIFHGTSRQHGHNASTIRRGEETIHQGQQYTNQFIRVALTSTDSEDDPVDRR